MQLAEKANVAAKAAEAALSGKEVIVQQLEQEIKEALSVVHEETNALQRSETNIEAAIRAEQEAQQEVILLSFFFNLKFHCLICRKI